MYGSIFTGVDGNRVASLVGLVGTLLSSIGSKLLRFIIVNGNISVDVYIVQHFSDSAASNFVA